MNQGAPKVQFIVTPFLPEHQPALGVSSLTAILNKHGIAAEIRYLNLRYAAISGWDVYHFIGNALPVELLLGELLFTPALWGEAAPSLEDYMARLDHSQVIGAIRKQFPNLRETVERLRPLYDNSPNIVREWADEVLRDNPTIVGFTSTFQQNVPSLALAKEIRRRVPASDLTILFGGANCETDMGRALANSFPFIDHVVSGEAEAIILDLLRSVGPNSARNGRPPRFVQGSMIADMNALPEPSFESYFDAVTGTPWQGKANLVAESSRGCWWGLKSHCTFCGLNGTTMAYRSKEPARFARELRSLKQQYGTNVFMLADNIMDMKYVRQLFPELSADPEGVELFYETKANLRKEQLVAMAAGGVIRLQPGIESLSSPILKLMDKGTTGLQNIQLLKWSEELKIGLAWNLLFGFPGEPAEEYRRMADTIGKIGHLPPPTGTGAIRLDRFSPYWRAPERHGLKSLRPFWAYDLVYGPLSPETRMQLAYFFDYDHVDGRVPGTYSAVTSAAVADWNRNYHHKHATLEIKRNSGSTTLLDSRSGQLLQYRLQPKEAALLNLLDTITHRDAMMSGVNAQFESATLTESELAEMLDRFLRRDWIIREGQLHLSVVLDRSERQKITQRKIENQLAQFGLTANSPELPPSADYEPVATIS